MALTNDTIIGEAKKIYRVAPRDEKCHLLTYLRAFYGCNRKYLISVLSKSKPSSYETPKPKQRGRTRIHTIPVHDVIIEFWILMRYPCSRVLKAQLTNILSRYEKRVRMLSDEIRTKRPGKRKKTRFPSCENRVLEVSF